MSKKHDNLGSQLGAIVGATFFVLLMVVSGVSDLIDDQASGARVPMVYVVPQVEAGDLSDVDENWLAELPPAKVSLKLDCLAQAIYFEARGEPISGQVAVGNVVMNRVVDSSFPNDVCAVIYQGALSGRCQFSFRCADPEPSVTEEDAYASAQKLAGFLMAVSGFDITDGATHFHTLQTNPIWSGKLERTLEIENHVFLKAGGDQS